MGSFVFKWPHPDANDVHVTGTFDDWGKSEQLNKVGDCWEKEVNLPSADEKILYKFVVDDNWIIDPTAPQEDDGHYNVNNVLLPQDIKRHAPHISSAAPTSSTAAMAGNVPLERKMSPPGGFPETPSTEPETFAVAPIPATSGMGNPVSLPAGEKVPEHSQLTSNTLESTATTSKEGYEKDASADFPGASSDAQAFNVQPIPATSGIGNPISLPAGEKVPDHSQLTSHTVDSTATTSKEGYERDASAALPAVAGIAGVGALGAAATSAFSKPEGKENLIPESSLPMGGDVKDTMDSGPHMSSAAPTSSTAALAAGVPLEKKRQAMVIDPADAPVAGDVETAPSVPPMVKESISEAHQAPEAAASSEAVKEKTAMESELLKKTETSEATGEPAGAAAEQSSYYGLATSVPSTVEDSMSKAHAPPEAAAETAVVAEKSAMEQELLKKVPSSEATGEPAPTIAAATSGTAPAATSGGPGAGVIAGAAATGAAAVAGTTAVLGSSKADTTSDAAPTKLSSAPVEKTEGNTTEDAPVRDSTAQPGVSSGAAAAVADNTEDPKLADEPAVKMMHQDALSAPTDKTTPVAGKPTAPTTSTPKSATAAKTTTPAATASSPTTPSKTDTPVKKVLGNEGTASSSPASSATKEKKKRNRLSRLYHKIVD